MSNTNITTLRGIIDELGISFPTEFSDVPVTGVQLSAGGEGISADISFDDLINASPVFKLLGQILPSHLDAYIKVDLGLSSGFELKVSLYDFKIRLPDNSGFFPVHKPMFDMNYSPDSGSWDVKLIGGTTIQVLGKNIDVNLLGIINETEVIIGLDVIEKESFLFTPPELKGVHIKEIGGELGMFFTPPGLDLGFTGQCYIGNQGQIALDDDKFAIVLDIQGETAEVKYLSFYVPQMDVNQLLEVFTNTNAQINTSISLSKLEFFYAPSSVLLPNGDSSPQGISGRCAIDIKNFGLYGLFKLSSGKDLDIDFECDPIHIKRRGKNILSVTGNGQGITQKVDKNGNPIKYNDIKNREDASKPLQDLIDNATEKQLVKSGGPVVVLQTKTSPYLNTSVHVQLLDMISDNLDASIDNNGFQFSFTSRALKTQGGVSISLKNRREFSASFFFKIKSPMKISKELGYFQANLESEAFLDASYKKGKIKLTVQAAISRVGKDYTVGPFEVSEDISTIGDLIIEIVREAGNKGLKIFEDLAHDAEKWTKDVIDGAVAGGEKVGHVLKSYYKKSAKDAAMILKKAGAHIDDVAYDLKHYYNLGSRDIAKAMKAAKYNSKDVGKALKKVGFSLKDVEYALHKEYGISGSTLRKVLGASGFAKHEIDKIGSKIKDIFKL